MHVSGDERYTRLLNSLKVAGPLFRDLPIEFMERLTVSVQTFRNFKPLVLNPGSLYVVMSGHFSEIVTSPEFRRTMALDIHHQGGVIIPKYIIGTIRSYYYSTLAEIHPGWQNFDALAEKVEREALVQCLQVKNKLSLCMLYDVEERIKHLGIPQLEQDHKFSITQMAMLAGSSREMLSRILKKVRNVNSSEQK